MPAANDRSPVKPGTVDAERLEGAEASSPVRVASLRGATANGVGRRTKLAFASLGLAVLLVVLVVSFLSVANDHARTERLKEHGVGVGVTVTNCTGNIGGSGSNGAGFTCRGTYALGGERFHERIGAKTTFSAPGTVLRGVVDPSHHGTVVLASAVKASSTSSWAYATLAILSLIYLSLVVAFVRAVRRVDAPRVASMT